MALRILVISHTYIVDLNCEKLRVLATLEPGIEVTIVVPQRWRPGGVQNRVIEPEPRQDGNFRVVPISNLSQNHQGLLCFGWGLVTLLRQFRPQVIQVEQGSRALAYAQVIFLNQLLGLGAKCFFFTWWNLPYSLKAPIAWLEAYNLRHTDGLVAGNQEAVAILRRQGYRKAARVMPQLGVDETLFCPQPQPQLAQALGIQPQEFVVGFVGRFVAEKGLRTLAQALEQVADRPWKWLLLGRGELETELHQWAEAAGLGDRLIWVESVPHHRVAQYLNLMQVLVLPSETTYGFKTLTAVGWKEQFGHVLIEAMACGVPVIGSDSGEIPHVIGEAGLVFPEGKGTELADRLRLLMDQPDTAQDWGQRGYQRCLSHYTNRALAQDLLRFYRDVVAGSAECQVS
ncbi:hormogonium polysaccharide biosynthesis glycosyltransferase HpsO [Prochlorothrix hollandica]|uniref:Glycosyl transferase family 1 n=2 Tax=Prochlorothrix hollandica TaxID=1223 RepID=A0A0M2PTF9_PROHO|nr:glycosyl transferase family 1 [Prochlorothrix hollandica PCC 9006 = CALU 1027]